MSHLIFRKDGNERKKIDLSKPLTAGAFVDHDKIKELHNTLSQQLPPELRLANKGKIDYVSYGAPINLQIFLRIIVLS